MAKNTVLATTGNSVVALAMKQINPDVVAAYPITPQTTVMEEFSQHVADGLVDTELVRVESEHSAMSCSIASAAAGARTMTATASQGLALMWEELYIASGLRLPLVLINVNRALSAPINIHCDHSDSMGARDSGWIQLYCENAQEAYDTTIFAVKIAENENVHLPVIVSYDGFIISHSIDRVEILEDKKVQKFVGDYNPPYSLIDKDNPATAGAFDSLGGYYYELKYNQQVAMDNAHGVIRQVFDSFEEISGRKYNPVEAENAEDADIMFVIAGSLAGSIREKINSYRKRGIKAGMLKIRSHRPFPYKEISNYLKDSKAVLVFDRANSPGSFGGPLFSETRSALYDIQNKPAVLNFIYGLGGRDLELEEIDRAFEIGKQAAEGKKASKINWISLKGKEV